MKGLLMIVYTVVTWYLSTSVFIVPLYLLSSIKPLKKTCNDLSRYIMGLSMNNASFFYRRILNLPLHLYGDKIDSNDSSLFLMNHRSSIDFLFFISLISEHNNSEKIKIVMKSILRFFPGLGWTCYINDFPFLRRNYASDKNYLNNLGKKLKDSNLLIFPEGTRYSSEKMISSNKYSREKGYPEYKNLLLPKSKGTFLLFKSMLKNKSIDAVYDLTINFDGIEKYKKHNTASLIYKNDIKSIHIHCRRIPVNQIPTDEDQFRKWLHQLYVCKDMILETPVNLWKNVYPVHIKKTSKSFISFNIILLLSVCFIYLLVKSKTLRIYHIILLVVGSIIVYNNSKYKELSKIKSNVIS